MMTTSINKILNIAIVCMVSLSLSSCFNEEKPNYQYMPNMYQSVGYNTYGDYEIFPGGQEAMTPPENTIPRGWKPYEYENSNAGLLLAKEQLKNPLPITKKNLEEGEHLFNLYCSICHGKKGDGQGILVKREKFLGVPSYADPGRNITEGGIYHVEMYGLNAMGSHASQTSEKERWQIAMHVLNLKAALKGEPLLELTKNDSKINALQTEMMSHELTEETKH